MSTATGAVSEQIRSFILQKFPLAKKRSVTNSDELLETGIVDSLGVLDLVGYMEQHFLITITDEELVPENFRSVERMAAFVESRTIPKA